MTVSKTLKTLSDTEYKNSKSLYAIDLMKFIMALCVVGIHTDPLKSYSSFINSLLLFGAFRLAVPFYFVSSSYLLFRKIDLNSIRGEIIRKYIYRLAIMYVLWILIYIPIIIQEYTSFKSVLRDVFFLGYGHLWYILASIHAVIYIYLLLRRRIKKDMFVLVALCAFIAGLSVSGYYKLIGGGMSGQ